MAEVALTWVTDLRDFSKWVDFGRPDLADGAAAWHVQGETRTLDYVCPCGCKDWRSIDVQIGEGRGWAWDGQRLRPTLTPSIRHLPPHCTWHGYLAGGVWKGQRE